MGFFVPKRVSMKENSVDVGDGLTVDIAPHLEIGMNILSKEDVARIDYGEVAQW